METFIIYLTFCALAGAVTHSLKYLYTTSSGIPNFPEFVAIGLVDDVEITYCDSTTEKTEPKQDWMNKLTADDPQYWENQTQTYLKNQQSKTIIETTKQCFNQTGGVRILQNMYGCEWDDETDEVNGYDRWGYDGEDFIAFDPKTETYIAPKQQAIGTKHKWDHDKARTKQEKQYITQTCPEWLKKYLEYGKSSLNRTEIPLLSLFQKTSSNVSCHATGFYPNRARMFWRINSDELQEAPVDRILPNHDGTFQMSIELNVSSISPENWNGYHCVFKFTGGTETNIRLDQLGKNPITINIITAAIISLLALTVFAGICIHICSWIEVPFRRY